jgi:predicted dehydrogenase
MWDDVIHRVDGVATVGYVDRRIEAAQAMASPRGQPFFNDLDTALAAQVADAVVLVTPPFSEDRLRQFSSLVRHRLPVLAEKPLTLDLESSVHIVREMEAAQLPLAISLQFRYLPVTREIRRIVMEGHYGRPGFAMFNYVRNRDGRAPYLNKYPLTMEHPMLLEQTIHHYDLIRYCYDSEPAWLLGHTYNPSWSMYAHDSNVAATMELENGMLVHYLGTWTSGWNAMQFEWRTDFPGGVLIQRELFDALYAAHAADEALSPVSLEKFTPFLDDTELLFREFLAAVTAGGTVPCTGRDHLQTLAMAFATIDSARDGRRIDMREFRRRHHIEGQ